MRGGGDVLGGYARGVCTQDLRRAGSSGLHHQQQEPEVLCLRNLVATVFSGDMVAWPERIAVRACWA